MPAFYVRFIALRTRSSTSNDFYLVKHIGYGRYQWAFADFHILPIRIRKPLPMPIQRLWPNDIPWRRHSKNRRKCARLNKFDQALWFDKLNYGCATYLPTTYSVLKLTALPSLFPPLTYLWCWHISTVPMCELKQTKENKKNRQKVQLL